MKRFIHGVTYNTEDATKVAKAEIDDGVVVLYRNRSVAFFLANDVRKQTWNERDQRYEEQVSDSVDPLNTKEAHQWLMEGDVEVYHSPFGDPPEAQAEGSAMTTIYIRVPSALANLLNEAARDRNLSSSEWIARGLRSILSGLVPGELAAIHWISTTIAFMDDRFTRDQLLTGFEEAKSHVEHAWTDLGLAREKGRDIAEDIMLYGASAFETEPDFKARWQPYREG